LGFHCSNQIAPNFHFLFSGFGLELINMLFLQKYFSTSCVSVYRAVNSGCSALGTNAVEQKTLIPENVSFLCGGWELAQKAPIGFE
jgi:hypothetical protein